jgi:hypothetical protein
MQKQLFVLKRKLIEKSFYHGLDPNTDTVFDIHKIYSNIEDGMSAKIKLDIEKIRSDPDGLKYYFSCSNEDFYASIFEYINKTFDVDFEAFINNLNVKDKISDYFHNFLCECLSKRYFVHLLDETGKFEDYMTQCFKNPHFRSPYYDLKSINSETYIYQVFKNPNLTDFFMPYFDSKVERTLFGTGVFFESKHIAFKAAASFVGDFLIESQIILRGSMFGISNNLDDLRFFLDSSNFFYYDIISEELVFNRRHEPPFSDFLEEFYNLFNLLTVNKQPFRIKKILVNDIFSETNLDDSLSSYWNRVLESELPF